MIRLKKTYAETAANLVVAKDEIKLCCKVCDPLTGYCKLMGRVLYVHTTLSNIEGFARVQSRFEMKSELHTPLMNCYPNSISGCSCDTVYINEMGMSFVEKNYPVANRPDIRLGIKYRVTIDGAEIIAIIIFCVY